MFWRLMWEVMKEVVGGCDEEIKKLGGLGGVAFALSSAKASQKAL